ncbi:hypothetical protein [Streptomyces sp. 891-h]|uniref:hypothetical protein n=1 Tax=Streptomyces sp. 891-h TaxID=2720714 RepID=UPI001FAAC94B|nr:hypothetical protein [Streptomyces sp. 891-h]UNZ20571.1 hypothetical protein HC362_29440 [Streptomyces sp. 891-h]
MSPRSTPTPRGLETYYTVKQATVRLGIATEDESDWSGQKWLRDGANRPADGSKGEPFPCTRMAGKLMFSESQLAQIAEMHVNAPERRGRVRKARKPAVKKPTPCDAELAATA